MKEITEEQGINIMDRCLNSMKERFLMTQNSFTVKIIRKDGIRILRAPEVPKGGNWLIHGIDDSLSDILFIMIFIGYPNETIEWKWKYIKYEKLNTMKSKSCQINCRF